MAASGEVKTSCGDASYKIEKVVPKQKKSINVRWAYSIRERKDTEVKVLYGWSWHFNDKGGQSDCNSNEAVRALDYAEGWFPLDKSGRPIVPQFGGEADLGNFDNALGACKYMNNGQDNGAVW